MTKRTWSDEMFTVSSIEAVSEEEIAEQIAAWAEAPPPQGFDEWISGYLQYIDTRLARLNLPSATEKVVEVDGTWTTASDSPSGVPGHTYILRQSEKPSEAWWLGRLATRAINILQISNPDEKLHAALVLGEERAKFEAHTKWLPSVRGDRKAKQDRRRGGAASKRPYTQQIVRSMKALVERRGMSERSAASHLAKTGEFQLGEEAIRSAYRAAKKSGRR